MSHLLWSSLLIRSSGGIIALGLFKMGWSVDKALHEFVKLSDSAFSRRELLEFPGFRDIAQLFCSFRYKSGGIERALIRAFGKDLLFGQRKVAFEHRVKVGVVAGIQGDHRPYIFANYNRNPRDKGTIYPLSLAATSHRRSASYLVV